VSRSGEGIKKIFVFFFGIDGLDIGQWRGYCPSTWVDCRNLQKHITTMATASTSGRVGEKRVAEALAFRGRRDTRPAIATKVQARRK